MNKNLAIVFGMFFVLLMVGIVSAASTQAIKDSYGQCVSQNAVLKNTCFSTTKQALATCKASAPQDEGKKDALKQCKLTYKTQKKQCKTSFKSSKEICKRARNAAEATASG